MNDLKEYKNFCQILAQASAEVIRKYFRTKISVQSKADDTPVTIADKKAEEIMKELIIKQYPDHGIIGEEFGNYNPDAEYVWVLDPIDGTKSFICGAFSFGTLIGLLKNNQPVLGVINQPILGEFLIGDNSETRLNGETVIVRDCNKIEDAVLITCDHFNIGKFQNQQKFDAFAKRTRLYRHWGDCYGYLLLAAGFVDIVIDPIMSAWDLLPLIPIIKGAGGLITDYQGNDPVKGTSAIAASTHIHSEIVSVLNNYTE